MDHFASRVHTAVVTAPEMKLSQWQGSQWRKQKIAQKIDLRSFLLSQCTIVCSILPEKIKYMGRNVTLIDERCNHLVNQNGDAWQNDVLLETYRTFRGAFNFVEHKQIISENKGRVLDSVIRKVYLRPPGSKPSSNDPFVYYVDILVATSLRFKSLIEKILDGTYNAMSMGCIVQGSECSYCGHQVVEPNPTFCDHLLYQRGDLLYHPAVNRKVVVAELCGLPGVPNTNEFIEASWVLDPAFIGARKAYIIQIPEAIDTSFSVADRLHVSDPSLALTKTGSVKTGYVSDFLIHHQALKYDSTLLKKIGQEISSNPFLRKQLNSYMQQWGFGIAPLKDMRQVVQRDDQRQIEDIQSIFRVMGVK